MSESASPSSPAAPAAPAGFGDNKGIKFNIKSGNATWTCTLQDRAQYERTKATRTNSADSANSASSSVSGSSH